MAKRSNAARGTYYRQRTKKWLEEKGYVVAQLERMLMAAPGLFVKKDQLGSDLLAVSVNETLFVQVKMGRAHDKKLGLEKAKQEFEKYPLPPLSQQWIVVWVPGAHEPQVHARVQLEYGAPSSWSDPAVQLPLRLRRDRAGT